MEIEMGAAEGCASGAAVGIEMGAAAGCASGAAKEDAKGAAAGCASGAAVEFEMGAAGSAVTSNVKLDGGTTATHKGGAGGPDNPSG